VLESISLKFTELAEPLLVPGKGVTIFVGPNNSGKSLVLREIEQDIVNHLRPETKILHDLEIAWMTEEALNKEIAELTKKAPAEIPPENVYVSGFDQNGQLYGQQANRNALLQFMREHIERRWITSQFLRMFFIRLDGRTRFALTSDRRRGDLLGPAEHILMQLFVDDQARKRVREIVFDAFGVYFTIEQLSENLRIRLSATEPDENEQSWNDAARQFHGKALHIKEASDGVQAFVGILCAVLSGDYRAILIDEPEAFLHPPLARKLGQQLTSNLKANGTLMASTHSPDFLMGCLQASPHVRVVRLEYSNGKSKGKIVDSAVLTTLFKAPLLRSANLSLHFFMMESS
jgi:predicted ATPase